MAKNTSTFLANIIFTL